MKTIVLCLIVAVGFVLPAAAQDAPRAIADRALAAAERYDTASALEAIDSALARNPDSGPLLLAKGRVLWQMKRISSAIDALNRAAKDKTTAAEAHYVLGTIYYFRGWQSEGAYPGWHEEPELRDKADEEFKAAIAADPKRNWPQPPAPSSAEAAGASQMAAYDARLQSYQANSSVPPEAIVEAIDAAIKYHPDPAPYMVGANLLVARNVMLDKAIRLAEASLEASEVFINENVASYKMSGKVQGSLARSRASAIDLIGWALFLKGDRNGAAAKLEEAERLSRGQDFVNQFHLAELARSQGELEGAKEFYLRALTLQGGAPALRESARTSLSDVYTKLGSPSAEFDTFVTGELDRRRKERQAESLRSLIDKPLPDITLTDLKGQPLDLAAFRGKVLLLNFFSSW